MVQDAHIWVMRPAYLHSEPCFSYYGMDPTVIGSQKGLGRNVLEDHPVPPIHCHGRDATN